MSAMIICFQEVLVSPYNVIKLLYSPSQHLIKMSNSYRDSLTWILAPSITIINYNENWRLSRECGTRRCLGSSLWFIIFFWEVQDLLKLPSILLQCFLSFPLIRCDFWNVLQANKEQNWQMWKYFTVTWTQE